MPDNYYAVIFTSKQTSLIKGYDEMALAMQNLAKKQVGYIGYESAHSEIGITISYWESLDAIRAWKANIAHLQAQKLGKEQWYEWYKVRICKVEREYDFGL